MSQIPKLSQTEFASNSEERQTDTLAVKELEHAHWLYEQQQSCYSHRKHI